MAPAPEVSTSSFCLVSSGKFIRIHLIPSSRSLMEILNSVGSDIDPTGDRLPVWGDFYHPSLGVPCQPVPHSLHRSLFQTKVHQFLQETVENHMENLGEVQPDKMHHSGLLLVVPTVCCRYSFSLQTLVSAPLQ